MTLSMTGCGRGSKGSRRGTYQNVGDFRIVEFILGFQPCVSEGVHHDKHIHIEVFREFWENQRQKSVGWDERCRGGRERTARRMTRRRREFTLSAIQDLPCSDVAVLCRGGREGKRRMDEGMEDGTDGSRYAAGLTIHVVAGEEVHDLVREILFEGLQSRALPPRLWTSGHRPWRGRRGRERQRV